MFIIKPKIRDKSNNELGKSFAQWLKSHIVYLFIGNNLHLYEGKSAISESPTYLRKPSVSQTEALLPSKDNRESPIFLAFKEALLMTYPCDGYDVAKHSITDFAGKVRPYNGKQSFFTLFITSFLNLPNRPMFQENRTAELMGSSTSKSKLKLYPIHVLLNFFGGWDFHPEISTEKRVWQYLALIPKIFIIFPIKLISIPFKIALNVVKIVTEFLPTFISFLLAYAYQNFFYAREMTDSPHLKRIDSLALALYSFFHFLTKSLSLIGRALTSPEKSARLAVAFSHEIRGKILGIQAGTIVAFIAGFFSVAVSASLWAITLPLAMSAALKFFPALMNIVTQSLIWISNLPFMSQILNILHTAFIAVIAGLNSIIAPIVLPIANLLSLQVSATLLYIAIAIGLLAFPITFFSRVADVLSNAWMKWHTSGPFTSWFSTNDLSDKKIHRHTIRMSTHDHKPPPAGSAHLPSPSKGQLSAPRQTPTKGAQTVVQQQQQTFNVASRALLSPRSTAPPRDTSSFHPPVEVHWATELFRGANGQANQLEFKTWYLAALMPILMNANLEPNPHSPILYFAPLNTKRNERISYNTHVSHLMQYAKEKGKPAIMLSTEPGAGENHFVVTLVTETGLLFYINPTTTRHKDTFQSLDQLKRDGIIAQYYLYQSELPLQHDDNSVVSCGPIGVELVRYFAVNIREFISKIKKQTHVSDDHYCFDLLDVLDDERLKSLVEADQDGYRQILINIRASHYRLLQQLNEHQAMFFAEQDQIQDLLKKVLGPDPDLEKRVEDFDLEEESGNEKSYSSN